MGRVPDAPALSVRDPWPGDPARGARLIKGELEMGGGVLPLRPGGWADLAGSPVLVRRRARVLLAARSAGARHRCRAAACPRPWWPSGSTTPPSDPIAHRPDVSGARITAWLGHYDFFAATADDVFRQRLMARLVADARSLSAALPAEELDARALTALKGLIAAAVALPRARRVPDPRAALPAAGDRAARCCPTAAMPSAARRRSCRRCRT